MGDQPMPGSDRRSFLARVSARLDKRPAAGPAALPAFDLSIARVVSTGADVIGLFVAAARAVGMQVHPATPATADERILMLLAGLGAQRIAVAEVPLLDGVKRALSERSGRWKGMELATWRDRPGVEPLYDCDAGVTDVRAAIAETGSLLCHAGPACGRGLSLVPPVHIAVVRASQVIPDLADCWPAGAERALPSSVVLITGPSKTADIEGILVTGVHGPREVHIVLIDDR